MIVRSLPVPKHKRDEWYERCRYDIEACIEARAGWWQDFNESHRTYRMIPPAEKNWPWPDSSNFVTPLTAFQCDQSKRRLSMYFVQSGEYIYVNALSALQANLDRPRAVQDLLRWQADAQLQYWGFVQQFTDSLVVGGTSVAEAGWVYEKTLVAEVLELGQERLLPKKPGGEPMVTQLGQPATKSTPIAEIIKEVLGPQDLQPRGGYRKMADSLPMMDQYEVPFEDSKGRRGKAVVQIDRREELGNEVQVIAIMPRVVKNQPYIRNLTPDRVIVPPGNLGIQDCELVGIKRSYPWWKVKKMLDKMTLTREEKGEIYDRYDRPLSGSERKSEEALKDSGTDGRGTWYSEGDSQDNRDAYVGVDSSRFERRMVQMIEVIRPWPIMKNLKDDDSTEHWPQARMMLFADLPILGHIHFASTNGVKDNRRNLVAHRFQLAENEFYGIGLPRILASLQENADVAANMEVDVANLTAVPPIFIDPQARLPRDNFSLMPGETVRVWNPQQSVVFPNWPSKMAEFEAQLARTFDYAHLLGHHGPSSVGQDGGSGGAGNRTARGAQIMLAEKNFNVTYDAEALAQPIQELWQLIYELDAANLPAGFEYRVQGTDEVKRLPKGARDIRGSYEFRFKAGQNTVNDEMRRILFMEFTQFIAPIAAASPEQVPKTLWELYMALAKEFGIKEAEVFMPTPIEDFGRVLTPDEEHQMLLTLGRPPYVHPNDIDAVHVQSHLAFAGSEQFQQVDRSLVGPFQKHILEHVKRMSAAGSGAGQPPGQTGQVLGGMMNPGQNPAVNSAPGQAARNQPTPVSGPSLEPLLTER